MATRQHLAYPYKPKIRPQKVIDNETLIPVYPRINLADNFNHRDVGANARIRRANLRIYKL